MPVRAHAYVHTHSGIRTESLAQAKHVFLVWRYISIDRGNDGACVPRCADARSVFARGAAGRHGVGAENFCHGAYYSAAVGASDSMGAGTVASDLAHDATPQRSTKHVEAATQNPA